MRVIVAEHMGMCFGVRDAIRDTEKIETPNLVTINGELVHNQQIQERLRSRGFHIIPELQRSQVPSTRDVLITAHGISNRERNRLVDAGKKLIDTTCPLVRRVHEAAMNFKRRGCLVIITGRHGHVEVEGIIGDLERYVIVESVDEVESYDAGKIGIVCQSTTPPYLAEEIVAAIRAKNRGKIVQFADTICRPTRERQESMEELLEKVEAVVVVGGRNSNNTRQLGKLAECQGVPWIHVQSPGDLEPEWFEPYSIVGLTAGTSTPDSTITAICEALLQIDSNAAVGSGSWAQVSANGIPRDNLCEIADSGRSGQVRNPCPR